MTALPPKSPRALLLAYSLPYLIYVGLGVIFSAQTQPIALYAARAVAVGAALVWASRAWLHVRGPRGIAGSLALGAVAGLAGTALWVALVTREPGADAATWSEPSWLARAVVGTALPPFVEETLMRGFVLPLVLLWQRSRRAGARQPFAEAMERGSLETIAPGEWSVLAVAISSAAFAAGHAPEEWLAAFAYGVLMCAVWIVRGDLVSCISAHAVTNAALAVYVRETGSWALW